MTLLSYELEQFNPYHRAGKAGVIKIEPTRQNNSKSGRAHSEVEPSAILNTPPAPDSQSNHNAGLEPNKSVIGNRHSLPLEGLDTPLSGYFEAQAISTTKEQHRIPTLEEPAPSDRIHHAEGRDSYPKISLVDESDEKAVSASSRPSAPNLFRRFINWIIDHSAYKNPQLENTNYGWRKKT